MTNPPGIPDVPRDNYLKSWSRKFSEATVSMRPCPKCGDPKAFYAKSCRKCVEPKDTLDDRFWAKVAKSGPDDCWLWTAKTAYWGYGLLGNGRRFLRAHRYSWERVNGPIPEGLYVLHRCDVPACVNPRHLFLGTLQDNSSDMVAKGRAKKPWAKLTAEQVVGIREKYAAGGTSFAKLAVEYGVTDSTIHCAVRGLTWREA